MAVLLQIKYLDLGPANLAGGSAGSRVSLLCAHMHPESVRSLILLHPPADNPELAIPFAEAWLDLARLAEEQGMPGVIEASQSALAQRQMGETPNCPTWIAESIQHNPGNADRITAMDAGRFSRMVRRWADFIRTITLHPGVTAEELQALRVPSFIVPGRDAAHPRSSAERLSRLLDKAVLFDYPPAIPESTPVVEGICQLFPAIDDWLRLQR